MLIKRLIKNTKSKYFLVIFEKIIQGKNMRTKKSQKQDVKKDEQVIYEPNLDIMELHISKKLSNEINNEQLEQITKDIRKKIMSYIGMNISQIKITTKESLEGVSYKLKIRKSEIFSRKIKKSELPDVIEKIQNSIFKEMKKYLSKLITRQDVVDLITKVEKTQPVLIQELKSKFSYASIHKVIKELLDDKIRLNDIYTIIEAMTDTAEYTKDTEAIVERVRVALSMNITQTLINEQDNKVHIITLERQTESEMVKREKELANDAVFNVSEIKEFSSKILEEIKKANDKNIQEPVLVVDPIIRKRLSSIAKMFAIDISVISSAELAQSAEFEIQGSISIKLN